MTSDDAQAPSEQTDNRPSWWRPPAPYQPGNTASLRHGAYSRRVIDARSQVVRTELLDQMPWTAEARFGIALDLAAEAVARAQLAHEAYSTRGNARNLEAATAASRLAMAKLDELGGTPAGFARLQMLAAGGAHAEASVSSIIAEGRTLIDADRAGEPSDSTGEPL